MDNASERIRREVLVEWLKAIGDKIAARRLELKEDQPVFAKRVGVAVRTLSSIETGVVEGKTGYGIKSLFRCLYGAFGGPGLSVLENTHFEPAKDTHGELHRKLQLLLDATDSEFQWPLAAEVNVEAVFALYQAWRRDPASGFPRSKVIPFQPPERPES